MDNHQPNCKTVSMLRWAVISPAVELFPHACKFKIKKTITIKPSIQIKFDCTNIFLMARYFKQDLSYLCLHDILEKHFLH